MKKTDHFLPLFATAMALASACGGHVDRRQIPRPEDTIPVTLMPLRAVGGESEIVATGMFTTDDETLLGFKNGGVVSAIHVEEGSFVRAGQRLASVQSAELDAKSRQAAVALEKAQRDYDRAQKLFSDSVATREQAQNALSALELARQDARAVAHNVEHLHIVSPVSGYVLARLANEGQVVGPGTPVLRVNGAGKGRWMLKVGVGDAQWIRIRKGDRAAIVTDLLPEGELRAFVARKSEGLDPATGTFAVYLEVENPPKGKMASGVFGRARISVAETPKTNGTADRPAWQVPYETLVDASGREAYVFVTTDGRTAQRRKIILATLEEDHATVARGLEDTDAIIVAGSAYLLDGSPIAVDNRDHD